MKKIKPYYYLIIIALIIFSWYMVPYLSSFSVALTGGKTIRIIEEVHGTFKCSYIENDFTEFKGGTFEPCWTDGASWYNSWVDKKVCSGIKNDILGAYYTQVNCLQSYGTRGCEVDVFYIDCKNYVDLPKYYKIGAGGNWQEVPASNRIHIYGNNMLRLRCGSEDTTISGERTSKSPMQRNPTYSAQFTTHAIYLEGLGYVKGGLREASKPDCSWVSSASDVAQLVALNPDLKNLGSHISIGYTQDITVALRDITGFNINPAGKYNGQDVMCKVGASGNSLYGVKFLGEDNTYVYYTQGNIIGEMSKEICCGGTDDCASGWQCENYKCILKKQVTCGAESIGTCLSIQKGTTISTKCVVEGDKYLIKSVSCTNAEPSCKIESTLREVQCCDGTCPYGYQCDNNPGGKGCYAYSILPDCPSTKCCLEGNDIYKTQPVCSGGLICCKADDNDNNLLTGDCKASCTRREEICDDEEKIDEDGNGFANEFDPQCQKTCEELCADNFFCKMKCLFGAYTYFVFAGVALLIIVIIYLLIFKKGKRR